MLPLHIVTSSRALVLLMTVEAGVGKQVCAQCAASCTSKLGFSVLKHSVVLYHIALIIVFITEKSPAGYRN